MQNSLTIIIPCKNEEKYIGNLLYSLSIQTYKDFNVIISDANSTDNTIQIINDFNDKLNIKIIEGGLPSIGRNNGAKQTQSNILLFIDSDIIFNKNVIKSAMDCFNNNDIDLITTKIKCLNPKYDYLYKINNKLQYLSKFYKPFSTGMFFMIRKDVFDSLGGFNETSVYAEDYELSSKINPKKFKIINEYIYTDDRRFLKMNKYKIIFMILNVLIYDLITFNKKDKKIFKKDYGYWK